MLVQLNNQISFDDPLYSTDKYQLTPELEWVITMVSRNPAQNIDINIGVG